MADDTIRECKRCDAQTNSGRRCRNRTCKYGIFCWVHHKLMNLAVKDSGIPGAGNGLFVYRAVASGTRIAQYTGKNVSSAEYGRRQHGAYGVTLQANNGRRTLDARSTQSGVARYANDCRPANRRAGHCRNNAQLEEVRAGRSTEVWVVATRRIRAGGEVFLQYNQPGQPDYWGGN